MFDKQQNEVGADRSEYLEYKSFDDQCFEKQMMIHKHTEQDPGDYAHFLYQISAILQNVLWPSLGHLAYSYCRFIALSSSYPPGTVILTQTDVMINVMSQLETWLVEKKANL